MPIAPKLLPRCTILDIRGTHGSGKSFLVHRMLQEYGNEPILEGKIVLGHKMPKINGVCVGPYTKVCGGCDAINLVQDASDRVLLWSRQFTTVVLEGIRVSHTFQRYHDLATSLKSDGHLYKFLFLDTPLELCIERVKSRRLARGNEKPFDPRNVISDYESIFKRTRSKCVAAGHDVIVVPWQTAWDSLKNIVEQDRA